SRGAVEGGVTEGEDAAVAGHQPVPAARRRGRHSDDGPVERQSGERAVGRGGAERPDVAAGVGNPVAGPTGGGGRGHDPMGEARAGGRSREWHVAEGEDAAV